MTEGPYRLETYGAPRQETAEECAARLAQMLSGLAALHPAFARWNQQAMTRQDADTMFCAMPPKIEELTQIFESGRHFTDREPRRPISELGYSVSAWNGADGATEMSMSLSVGSYDRARFFPNHVEMNFRRSEPANATLVNEACLREVLRVVVAAWNPSWANLADPRYWEPLYRRKHVPDFRSGWMTYLSAPYAHRVTPPSVAVVEPVPDGGLVILATKDLFDSDNPVHMAAADAIQACLQPLQANPALLESRSGWCHRAGFIIYLRCFRNGQAATFERVIFDRLFAAHVIESDGAFMRVSFPDRSGGDITIEAGPRIFSIAFSNCNGNAFFDAVYELTYRTRSILSWDTNKPECAIVDPETLDHVLPEMRRRLGTARVIHNGRELENYILDDS